MDSLAEFKRKNDAQFAAAEKFVTDVQKEFTFLVMEALVVATPGEGNQYPPGTSYKPTGRLRGGWGLSQTVQPVASRYTGGPLSILGAETIERLRAEIEIMPVGGMWYLQNDVAYGFMIVDALGNHTVPRPWHRDVAAKQNDIAKQAVANVLSRG